MKRFLRHAFYPLYRDDLFVRVLCLIAGLAFCGLGTALMVAVAGCGQREPAGIQILCWLIAIVLAALGSLQVSRSMVPAQSRMARFAENTVTDGCSLTGIAFIIAMGVVVALLTLFLRWLGVRGQRVRNPARGPGLRPAAT